jgi:hypothetical protein
VKAIVLIASMIMLSGCTSSTTGEGSTSTTFHATASPRPSTSPLDQKTANVAVLRRSDVGSGYTEKPYIPSAQTASDDAIEQHCLGRPPTATEQTTLAYSPVFTEGDAKQVLASVTFVRSSIMATDDFDALRSGVAPACLRKIFTMQLRRTLQETPRLDLKRISFSSGNANVCEYRFRVTVGTSAGDLTQYLDLISAIRGRAEVQATFQNVNAPADHAFEEHVINAMLQRL